MTGIERLYKLIADIDVSADPRLWDILRWGTEGDWDCEEHDDKTLDSTLAAIADQIELERNVRDLEEHDAAAWVRDHGGLDAVKRRWECLSYYADPVPRSCMEKRLARLQRQIDESHAALRRKNQRIEELGNLVGDLTTENAELQKRLMPEGMEWPRYESGELVQIGEEVDARTGGSFAVGSVTLRVVYPSGAFTFLDPERLTHTKPEPPDSAERIADEIDRLREEVALHLGDYLYDEDGNDSIQFSMELVAKRCRALAERESGE